MKNAKEIQKRFSISKKMCALILAVTVAFGTLAFPTNAFAANLDTVVDTYKRVFISENGTWRYSYTGYYTYKSINYKNGYYLHESIYLRTQLLDWGVSADLYRNVWRTW
jgi:hypothetical protein